MRGNNCSLVWNRSFPLTFLSFSILFLREAGSIALRMKGTIVFSLTSVRPFLRIISSVWVNKSITLALASLVSPNVSSLKIESRSGT
jgi:hypothetical protein